MISQLELPMYLADALPEISDELKLDKKSNAYQFINLLTVFTFKNIAHHNYKVAKRCFKIADKLYGKGNAMVKNAIENTYVYSFSRLLSEAGKESQLVMALIPGSLYSIYINQIHKTGK